MDNQAKVRVLYCDCATSGVVPTAVRSQVRRKLDAAGVTVEAVPDLCELSARKDPVLRKLAEADGLRIAACYPRAVRWLFHAGGAPLADGRVTILNMRTLTGDEIAEGLLSDLPERLPETITAGLDGPARGSWIPWFPVIDRDRCTNCKQCLSFCLFDVFAVDGDENVAVRNPDHCKTDCPACARVCPNVAIMFPKHDQSPVNGDEVRGDDITTVPVKIDVSTLLRGDLRESLLARSGQTKERFSTSRSPDDIKAERLARLRAAQDELGIPDGALPTLPPMCDCQRKALEAEAKAARARGLRNPERREASEAEWGI